MKHSEFLTHCTASIKDDSPKSHRPTAKEINEAIKEKEQEIKKIDKSIDKISDDWWELAKKKSLSDRAGEEYKKAREAKEKKVIALQDKLTDAKIMIQVLKNNFCYVIGEEVKKAFCQVASKYNGKPYGEKTRDKIAEETKAVTGCRAYFSRQYSTHSIKVYCDYVCGSEYDIELSPVGGTIAKPMLDSNDKIIAPTADSLRTLYASKYIDDIIGYIEALKAAHKSAREKEEELKAACNAFNALTVHNIEHIYPGKISNNYGF